MAIALPLILTGCAEQSWDINRIEYVSKNHSSRVRLVVIHYTAGNFRESAATLTGANGAQVSSHYLIPALGDASYTHDRPWVFQLVDDDGRAWHAGRSYWQGMTSLNDNSIGIEITNESWCDDIGTEVESCREVPFEAGQITALVRLLGKIEKRHGKIPATRYIGHADIAPERKRDPGPLFPWKELHDAGYGAWPDPETVAAYQKTFSDNMPSLSRLQGKLREYGYAVEVTGEQDQQTTNAVRAFQQHFRPASSPGIFDLETASILYALLEKYL